MVSGNQIRLSRILRKGRMLCIPMDHGISNGPISGLEDPVSIIQRCDGRGITSVIINKGILKALPKPIRAGILVHFSSSTSLSTAPNRKMLTGTVKEAASMGADGVSLHINIGGKEEPEMLRDLGDVAGQCHKWGMPLLAMMYPRGENIKNPHDPEIVAHAARIGAECGADIVKTLYTGGRGLFCRHSEEHAGSGSDCRRAQGGDGHGYFADDRGRHRGRSRRGDVRQKHLCPQGTREDGRGTGRDNLQKGDSCRSDEENWPSLEN